MRSPRSVVSNVSRASAMLATVMSSTNTCGASRTSPLTGCARGVDQRDRAAVAVADEHRPLDVERSASSSGSTSSASSCMKRGVRGLGRHVGLPVAGARVDAARGGRSPPPAAAGNSRHSPTEPSPSCRNTSAGSAPAISLVSSSAPPTFTRPEPAAAPRAAGCATRRSRARRARAPTAPRRARPRPGSPPRRSSRSRQAARAEADVPALVAQHQLGARRQPRQPVVDEVEQRELAGGEDHALQDHVVEPDRLAAARPRAASGSRTSNSSRNSGRHVRARVVEPDGARRSGRRSARGAPRRAAGRRSRPRRGPSGKRARCSATPASPTQKPGDELGQPRAGDLRPGAPRRRRARCRARPTAPRRARRRKCS